VARAFNEAKLFVSRCSHCVVARAFNKVCQSLYTLHCVCRTRQWVILLRTRLVPPGAY